MTAGLMMFILYVFLTFYTSQTNGLRNVVANLHECLKRVLQKCM